MDKKLYEKTRIEFADPAFKKKLFKELGSECCNCHSDKNVVYHHIVPIEFGGTNRITNIVPLCSDCHRAAHAVSHHINENKVRTGKKWGGAKSKRPDGYEDILELFINGLIGRKQCKVLLGLEEGAKLTCIKWCKEYFEKLGIQRIWNYVDSDGKFRIDWENEDSVVVNRKYKDGSSNKITVKDVKNMDSLLKKVNSIEAKNNVKISRNNDVEIKNINSKDKNVINDFIFGKIGRVDFEKHFRIYGEDDIYDFEILHSFMKEKNIVYFENNFYSKTEYISVIKFDNKDVLKIRKDGKKILTNKKYLL